jgi:hypothetical protein
MMRLVAEHLESLIEQPVLFPQAKPDTRQRRLSHALDRLRTLFGTGAYLKDAIEAVS